MIRPPSMPSHANSARYLAILLLTACSPDTGSTGAIRSQESIALLRNHHCAQLLSESQEDLRNAPFGVPPLRELVSQALRALDCDNIENLPPSKDGLSGVIKNLVRDTSQPIVIAGDVHNDWRSIYCTGELIAAFSSAYPKRGTLILESMLSDNEADVDSWRRRPALPEWPFCPHFQAYYITQAPDLHLAGRPRAKPEDWDYGGDLFAARLSADDFALSAALREHIERGKPIMMVSGLLHTGHLLSVCEAMGIRAHGFLSPGAQVDPKGPIEGVVSISSCAAGRVAVMRLR